MVYNVGLIIIEYCVPVIPVIQSRGQARRNPRDVLKCVVKHVKNYSVEKRNG